MSTRKTSGVGYTDPLRYIQGLEDELARLREAANQQAFDLAQEIARLREAVENMDAVAMRAGGGTGWGPLAEVHDIASNALKRNETGHVHGFSNDPPCCRNALKETT